MNSHINSKIELDALEEVYSLNFHTNKKDIIEFSQSSWNLASLFLSSIGDMPELVPKQKVCIFMLGKSLRLLRAIFKLIEIGHWTEAEMLFRALFETQMLLSYILRDTSNKRADTWLKRTSHDERWPVAETFRGIDDRLKTTYSKLSLYPHNHILSVNNYVNIHEGKISVSRSALGGESNNNKAGQLLGIASMTNAAICEVCSHYFNLPKEWHESHVRLMQLPYFLSTQPMVKDFLTKKENTDLVNNILNKNTMKNIKLYIWPEPQNTNTSYLIGQFAPLSLKIDIQAAIGAGASGLLPELNLLLVTAASLVGVGFLSAIGEDCWKILKNAITKLAEKKPDSDNLSLPPGYKGQIHYELIWWLYFNDRKILVIIPLSTEEEVNVALNRLPESIDSAFRAKEEYGRLVWDGKNWNKY